MTFASSNQNITDSDIIEHLRREYKGIFPDNSIDSHFENYVKDKVAEQRIKHIANYGRFESILDIGCGYGAFVILANRNRCKAIGLEIQNFQIAVARQRLIQEAKGDSNPECIFVQGSAYALPFQDQSFDAITLWDVLEHVDDYEKVMIEAHRVLKTGGKIFISCPNYLSFRSEAHYQVMWLPLLPKPIAAFYLSVRRKNPSFLLNSIFYTTNFRILRTLFKLRFKIIDHRIAKISNPRLINQKKLRDFLFALQFLKATSIINFAIKIQTFNPFKKSIYICAEKRS